MGFWSTLAYPRLGQSKPDRPFGSAPPHEEWKMGIRTLVLIASILLCRASLGAAVDFLFAPAYQTGLAPHGVMVAHRPTGASMAAWKGFDPSARRCWI